jgi:hypothetical protein
MEGGGGGEVLSRFCIHVIIHLNSYITNLGLFTTGYSFAKMCLQSSHVSHFGKKLRSD